MLSSNIKNNIKKAYYCIKKFNLRVKNNKRMKKLIKGNSINYKDFWKRYDKHYSSIAHNFYYEKTGIDSKYFIPDAFWYSVIDMKLNDWVLANSLDNKNLYDKYFYDIKQPITYAKKINGHWFIDDKCSSFNEVLEKLNNINEVVCKEAVSSFAGYGVRFFNKENFYKIDNFGKELIVQEVLKQSNELNKLCKTSLNTIRVMTLLIDNKIEVLSTIVRFGLNGSRVDNASSGGATCGIEKDGRLKNVAYKIDGTRYNKNPNTGEAFNNIVIPNMNKILELAVKCHSKFPFFNLISWDFAITEDDAPILIEGNFSYGGLDINQLNNGPIFGDKTEEYLNKILKM